VGRTLTYLRGQKVSFISFRAAETRGRL